MCSATLKGTKINSRGGRCLRTNVCTLPLLRCCDALHRVGSVVCAGFLYRFCPHESLLAGGRGELGLLQECLKGRNMHPFMPSQMQLLQSAPSHILQACPTSHCPSPQSTGEQAPHGACSQGNLSIDRCTRALATDGTLATVASTTRIGLCCQGCQAVSAACSRLPV